MNWLTLNFSWTKAIISPKTAPIKLPAKKPKRALPVRYAVKNPEEADASMIPSLATLKIPALPLTTIPRLARV
jgi:hypothetical protein